MTRLYKKNPRHQTTKTPGRQKSKGFLRVLVAWWQLLFLLLLFNVIVLPAYAEERILSYHSDIKVLADASMQVTETIRVRAERKEIKRGIYRDFPTDYKDRFGNRYRVGFEVVAATRDGRREDWHTKPQGRGVRVYIGNKDVYLDSGDYSYSLTYRTNRQLGFFDDHDELYWNVTGNGCSFPIEEVTASVSLPEGLRADQLEAEAYTGPSGAKGNDYSVSIDYDGTVSFATTRSFGSGEGLTIVVSWPKGYVHEPTSREELNNVLRDNRSWVVLLVGLVVLLAYYMLAWVMVGRDPEEGVVMTRYAPPEGVSPAAARFIERMGYDHKAFAAALVNLAVKGLIEIKEDDKQYTLIRSSKDPDELVPGEKAILKHLFNNLKGVSFPLEQSKHATIRKAIKAHEEALLNNNEKLYFLRNRGWMVPGILLSLLFCGGVYFFLPNMELKTTAMFLSVWLTFWTLGLFALGKKVWFAWRSITSPLDSLGAIIMTLFFLPFFAADLFVAGILTTQTSPAIPVALLSAVVVNMLFHYLLKAPTRAGRQILDQLEGFRQFLEVAEREEMNFRHPPEKTPELFERFLPYALALGVEQHWMERFAGLFARLDASGEAYHPVWYHGPHWQAHNFGNFASSIGNSLGAAVASNSTAPGSSSGSGGGGSSGGGGGGGGGGGW